jgi:glycosyltransferase involved in cell wall biosynthesis
MNIAIFIKSTTFHKGFGGFETMNKTLSEALVKKGHRVVVYAPKKELNIDNDEENGVIYRFIECKFGKFKALYSHQKNSWENKSVKTFLDDRNRIKYDLVLGQSSWALPIIRIKNQIGVRVVSVLHGSKIGEYQTQLKNVKSMKELLHCIRDLPHVLRAFFITQREFVHGSDKLVAVSNFVKKTIVEETFVQEDKVTVIYNGVDESKFAGLKKAKSEPGEEVHLIYVGRIIRAKGLFVLVNSLSRLKNLNWKLNIVGDGDALEQLKNEISRKNLPGRINLKGFMKYEDVIKELDKSDIFILPTMRMEGFPMTIVEAMFSGLPVVASDIGGNPDTVVDGETGYLVKPGSADELSDKLTELINNADKRLVFGENGRKRAYKEFTIDRMVDKYEQVFLETLR